jgi:hypothetical protein
MQGCNEVFVPLPAQPCTVGRILRDEASRKREETTRDAWAPLVTKASLRLVDRVAAPDAAWSPSLFRTGRLRLA